MANINQSLVSDLLELNLVESRFKGDWPHREFVGYQIDLGNCRRLGLSRGTAYRWFESPPDHFKLSLQQIANLQRQVRELQSRSLPDAWHTNGFWFDRSGLLVCGSPRANPFKWDSSDLLANYYRMESMRTKIRYLEKEADDLRAKLKAMTAANDASYYQHGQ